MAIAPPHSAREEPLGEPEVNELLLRIQDRFAWAETAPEFVVTDRWVSRTATLYRCRNGAASAPDVVLKVARGWTAEEARALWSEMRRLDDALVGNAGTSVRVAPVLGWTHSPPAVCTSHITGTDIYFMFTDLDHEAWRWTRRDPFDVVAECGRALGVYHSVGQDPSSAAAREADADLAAASRAVRISSRLVGRIAEGLPIAPSFGDFGIHQFRLSDTGELYLLDPPTAPSYAPIHRDIAWFNFGLIKVLGRENSRRRRRIGSALCEAFCAGYAATGPVDPRTPENRWVTSIYRGHAAGGTAHKRLREGAYAAAFRHGSQWLSGFLAAHLRKAP